MTIADISVIVAIGFFAVIGYLDGIIKKFVGILSLVLAFYIAVSLYEYLGLLIYTSLDISETAANIISFLVIFLTILILGNALYRVGRKKNELFKMWDRLAGSLFGLVEGLILISIAIHVLLILFDLPNQNMRAESIVYPVVQSVAPLVFELIGFFAPHVREFFNVFFENLNLPDLKS